MLSRGLGWLVIGLMLAGCGTSEVKPLTPISPTYPNWFLNPQKQDASRLVGVGEGVNREEAIQAALVDLLSQLSIEVAATFETRLSVHKQGYESVERVSEKQIQASVASTEIRNYQVQQVKRLGYDKTLALVSVSRSQLFADIKALFEQDLANLKMQQALATSQLTLSQYLFYLQHQPQVTALQQQLKILKTLDADFTAPAAQSYLQDFLDTSSQLKQQVVFYLNADDQSEKFVAPLQNALSQAGFKVHKMARPGQNARIVLSTQWTVSEAYGFKIVRVTVTNQVMSGEQSVGGQVWSFKGQALIKEANALDLALQRVAQKLQSLIEQQGLNRFLGVNLILEPA